VHGQIGVETADIYGKVEENMVVQQKLTVRATGTVSGAVTYSKVMVEEGGVLAGTFNMLSARPAEKAKDAKAISLQQAE
jgi:cytoskeletal protein CcmA (bactofilin family)